MLMPMRLKSFCGITAPSFRYGAIMKRIEVPGNPAPVFAGSTKMISTIPAIVTIKMMAFYLLTNS